jgi:hypothetical protein
MAQQTHRANLSSTVFPMTLAKAGRSVIIPTTDQNFDKRVDANGNDKGSVGIPQAIYLENVFPTPDGFQSIGLKPRTAITTPGTINALQQVYFASSVTTSETSPVISITDAGDELETWTTSANYFARLATPVSLGDSGSGLTNTGPSAAYSEIAESTGVGNPANSYRMSQISDSAQGLENWMYKDFALDFSVVINGSVDFRFTTGASDYAPAPFFQRIFDLGLCVDERLTGAHVIYDSYTGTFRVYQYTNGLEPGFAVLVATGTITTPLAYNIWYTLTFSVTSNDDGTKTVYALVEDSGGTDFCTVTGIIPAGNTFGGGVSYRHPQYQLAIWKTDGGTNTVSPNRLFIDNLDITADTAIVTNTKFSGVQTLYIAYHSDNTATWSYSLDTWTNNPVTENGFTSPLTDSEVSYGFARGTGYVCIRTAGVAKIYSLSITGGTTLVFTEVTATINAGLPVGVTVGADVICISSSYNYLVLFTASTQYWSSTTTPTDFEASLVSGAGFDIPANLKGDITFVKEHLAGFFIYTAKNAVFCSYTGNSKYPWKWREVAGSSGFTYATQVAGSTNASSQYGLTNSKYIQQVAPDGADLIAPEVTNFLSTQTRWDIFNSSTNVFTLSSSGTIIDVSQTRLWFVLDRYVIVPYGFASGLYGYATVFDLLLRRYGKIKATFNVVTSDDTDFYLVRYDTGAISKVYFDIYDQDIEGGGQYEHEGVLILGKFQLVRARLLQMEEVEVEAAQDVSITPGAAQQFSVVLLPSLDGKTFDTAVALYKFPSTSVGPLVKYLAPQVVGTNVSVAVKGAFDINTLQLVFTNHGAM